MPHAETGQVHLGQSRGIRIAQEDTWGTVAAAPSWTTVPYLDNGFTLKATSPLWRPKTNIGTFRQSINLKNAMVVGGGDLRTLPIPDYLGLLLDMALLRNPADNWDLYPYTIDHYTPADPRRYLGAVAERLEIAATGDENGAVLLTLGLRARQEAENNSLAFADCDYDGTTVPFMFKDARLITLEGMELTDVEAFTIRVDNNLSGDLYRYAAGADLALLGYLLANKRTVTVELTKLDQRERINDAIRAGTNMSFHVRFTHPAGHIWEIQIPNMIPPESPEDGTPDQPAKANPRFDVGTDANGDDIVCELDLGPPTTTLAGLTTTTAGA